ncbi:YolD-like family protein [Bacillus sp. AK128]
MIRDRGNIKWTAMMLPEHVKLLRDWAKEDEYETKPELDEQKLEQMNEVICEAMAHGAELSITYFDQVHHKTVRGTIHYVDEMNQRLRVVSKEGTVIQIPFHSIVEVIG